MTASARGRVDLAAVLDTPTPVASPGGHAWAYARTAARLAGVLDRLPVTRVYDATALDRLGVPVWAAVTPLAADLTVHAGKGVTAAAAQLSATMEAVERVCAESAPGETLAGSAHALRAHGVPILDPSWFDPPFGWTAGPATTWVGGYDLLTERSCWVPRDFVISPGPFGADTNGLAAGNVVVEAVLHGLLEVIERDAVALRHLAHRHREPPPPIRRVDLETLPAALTALVARLREAELAITLEDVTHDLGIPVLRAALDDRAFPGREGVSTRFEGYGADLDPVEAATRALTEAAQSHTATLVGAREAFEGEHPAPVGRGMLLRWLATPGITGRLPPTVGPLATDLRDRLAIVIDRLRGAGFAHCAVIELTRPELGIPVVRVLLAGAAGPYPESPRRPSRRLLRELV